MKSEQLPKDIELNNLCDDYNTAKDECDKLKDEKEKLKQDIDNLLLEEQKKDEDRGEGTGQHQLLVILFHNYRKYKFKKIWVGMCPKGPNVEDMDSLNLQIN